MKFVSETANTKFHLPPWRVHWLFLSSSTARPFLLLSVLIHAVLLGVLWHWLEVSLAPQNANTAATGQRFDILLNGAPPRAQQDRATTDQDKQVTPAVTRESTVQPPRTEPKESSQPVDHRDSVPKRFAPHPPTPLPEPDTKTEQVVPSKHVGSRTTVANTPDRNLRIAERQTTQTHPLSKQTETGVTTATHKPLEVPPRKNTNESSANAHHVATSSADDADSSAPGSTRPSRWNTMITEQVRSALKHHLQYPYLARRRGWDGQVLVGFQINRDGQLINIHLSKSSGHAILDSSALTALHKIKRLRVIPVLLRDTTDKLSIPVVFRLTQG